MSCRINWYALLNCKQPFLESVEGREWSQKLFHDQYLWKYGTGPGSNSRPMYLQSDLLLTAMQPGKISMLYPNQIYSLPKNRCPALVVPGYFADTL